jgi:hypothetical protein
MIMILRSQIASIGDRFSARHIGRPLLWESEALIWLRVSDPTAQMSFSSFRLQKILNANQTWSLASEVVAISPQRRVRGVSGNQARQKAGLRCLRYDIKPGLYQSALCIRGHKVRVHAVHGGRVYFLARRARRYVDQLSRELQRHRPLPCHPAHRRS